MLETDEVDDDFFTPVAGYVYNKSVVLKSCVTC